MIYLTDMTPKEELIDFLMDLDGGEFYIPAIQWAKAILKRWPQIESKQVFEGKTMVISSSSNEPYDTHILWSCGTNRRVQVFIREVK